MSTKKKVLLLFGTFLICVTVINQFVFPMGWLCTCFSEDNAEWVCRQECGSDLNCEGWARDMEGICYMGMCYIDGWVFCADTGYRSVNFIDVSCEECFPAPW